MISARVGDPLGFMEPRGAEGKRRGLVQLAGFAHLAVGLLLMVAKIAFGILSGSKALVVSAMLSMQDCVWTGVVLVRSKTGQGHNSEKHPFGLGKVEFIVAGWMSLLVLLGVAVLCGMIAHSLLEHRQRAPGMMAVWVAMAGALVCLVAGHYSSRVTDRAERRGMATHARLCLADACCSIAVIASVIIARAGFELIDSIVAMLEAAYVVWSAGGMLYGSAKGLLDASVGSEKIAEIDQAIHETPGTFDVSSIRATRSGEKILATVVLDLPDAMSVTEADNLRRRISTAMRRRLDDLGQVLVGFRARDERS